MLSTIDDASVTSCSLAASGTTDGGGAEAPSSGAGQRAIDLEQMSLSDVVRISSRMRTIGDGCESMEEAAEALVRHLYDHCRSADGGRQIALVRCFKTHVYGALDEELQAAARQLAGAPLDKRTRCLTLLATAGARPQWRSRRDSVGHKAIPLVSEQAVGNIPMIAQLIRQFGLEIRSVVDPREDLVLSLDNHTCNVFHVEHALGSCHIPAQDQFVVPLGVRSALGFGGMLPTGNLFAVIAFTTAKVPPETAQAFRSVALAVKSAILRFEPTAVFRWQRDLAGVADGEPSAVVSFAAMRSKANALDELGKVHDHIVVLQAERLERTVEELAAINRSLGQEIEQRKAAEAERERLQGELIAASRQAGMAEVATGVLHNVGNVLTSVNVSVDLLVQRLRRDWSSGIQRLSTLLAEHEHDLGEFFAADPRGRQIPEYLARLAESLTRERTDALDEGRRIAQHVEHVKTVIAAQQNLARSSSILEEAQLAGLVEDALRLNAGALDRHEVALERQFADLPPLVTDRHKVLQILVNLIRNAKQAVTRPRAAEPRIVLRIFRPDDGFVAVEVRDNGVGITPEDLRRIFTHGFTTRPDGHGFGLHASVLFAKELGGSLEVRSDGPGQGAAFTLRLPLSPADHDSAAPAAEIAAAAAP